MAPALECVEHFANANYYTGRDRERERRRFVIMWHHILHPIGHSLHSNHNCIGSGGTTPLEMVTTFIDHPPSTLIDSLSASFRLMVLTDVQPAALNTFILIDIPQIRSSCVSIIFGIVSYCTIWAPPKYTKYQRHWMRDIRTVYCKWWVFTRYVSGSKWTSIIFVYHVAPNNNWC